MTFDVRILVLVLIDEFAMYLFDPLKETPKSLKEVKELVFVDDRFHSKGEKEKFGLLTCDKTELVP